MCSVAVFFAVLLYYQTVHSQKYSDKEYDYLKICFDQTLDGKNKFERLLKPLTVEQVLNGMMIPCQKSEQPNKMRKCEKPNKMRKCEQPNKMRKCEQHNKMRTCEQPNNMILHIEYNKTSVPVFYRRIKFRYEFGCV